MTSPFDSADHSAPHLKYHAMHHGHNSNGKSPPGSDPDQRPYALLGAGVLVSRLWKEGDPDRGWTYRFNLFRMSAASGHVSQQFRPADVFDLIKLCRILAAELVHDGCLPQSQRKDLAELAARLDSITRLKD